jgi:predicted acyl esterase
MKIFLCILLIFVSFSTQIFSKNAITEVIRTDFYLNMPDGVLLDCTKFIPVSAKPPKGFPAIIFCHGFGDSKQTESEEAEAQAKFGYYTLCYSMRGQGHSGGLSNLISTKEMDDFINVLNYVKKEPSVDSTIVCAFGASQGGIIPFMAACNGVNIKMVVSDLASPEFASSWIENGCIKMTLAWSVDYDSTIVRYDNDVKKIKEWILSKESDKWDSLSYYLPRGRDFMDKLPFNKIPIQLTNAWQDKFFNASGVIKGAQLLKCPFRIYLGAVDGHGSDSIHTEDSFLTEWENDWMECWIHNYKTSILDSPKYNYAVSHFPRENHAWSFTHHESSTWPPAEDSVRFYFHPKGGLSELIDMDAPAVEGFLNDVKDSTFTMRQAINTSFKGSFFDERFAKKSIEFETHRLSSDLLFTGVPKLQLFYSSTADICQYNVQVWEVTPSGLASLVTRINFTDRHYHPGEVRSAVVEGWAHSHLFKQGNRIRIIFTNLDTTPDDNFLSSNPYVLPVLKRGYNNIYLNSKYSSFIQFPVQESSKIFGSRSF